MSDENYSLLEIHNDIFNGPRNILNANQLGAEIHKMDFPNSIDHSKQEASSLQQDGLSQQDLLHLILELSRQSHIQIKCLATEVNSFREEVTQSTDKKVHDLLLLVKNSHQEILSEIQSLKNENAALKSELSITRSMLSNFSDEYVQNTQHKLGERAISNHNFDRSSVNQTSPNTGVRIPAGINPDRQIPNEKPSASELQNFLENFNHFTAYPTSKPPFDITQPRGRFHSAVELDFIRDRNPNFDLFFQDSPHRFNNQIQNNAGQANNPHYPNSNKMDTHNLHSQTEISSNSLKLLGSFHNNSPISTTNNNPKAHPHKERFQFSPNSLAHLGDNPTFNTSSNHINSSGSPPGKDLLHSPAFNSTQNMLTHPKMSSGIPNHDFDSISNENSKFFLSEPNNTLPKTPLRNPDINEKENNHLENLLRELDNQPNGYRNRAYSISSSSREPFEQTPSQLTCSLKSPNKINYIVAHDENVNPKLESSFLTSKENIQNALFRLEWRIRYVSLLATHSQSNGSITSTFSDPDGELDDILLKITVCSSPSSNDEWANSHYGLALSIPCGKIATYVFQCGNERKPARTNDFSISKWDGYDDFGRFGSFVHPHSDTLHIEIVQTKLLPETLHT